MGKFIEQAHDAIDDWRPFLITLDKISLKVEKIIYPKVDPLAETGDENDLYPKKNRLDFPRPSVNFPPAN